MTQIRTSSIESNLRPIRERHHDQSDRQQQGRDVLEELVSATEEQATADHHGNQLGRLEENLESTAASVSE